MFGENLKSARIAMHFTQSELAEKLMVKNTTISNWEKGISNPDIMYITDICNILQVEPAYFFDEVTSPISLSVMERSYIQKYRAIDYEGQQIILSLLDYEYRRAMKTPSIQERNQPYLYEVAKPEYLTGLSAGSGLFVFDDIPTQMIQIPAEYYYVDFVIGVSGDSMEPDYDDGDKVMVVKQDQVQAGEIGVFMIDGIGYIKEYQKHALISHNKKYQDILFEEHQDIYCIGKVAGKV